MKPNYDNNKINVQIRQPHITIYNFSNNHNSTKDLCLNKILKKVNLIGNQEKVQKLQKKDNQGFLSLKSKIATRNSKQHKLNKCDNNSLELFTQRRQCAFLRNITSSYDDLHKNSTYNFNTKYNNFVVFKNMNKNLNKNNINCPICQDYFVTCSYPIIFNNLRSIKEKYVSENDANSIDYIIFNVKSRLVALFKENLIYSDQQEFLKRFYTFPESQLRIRNAVAYYSTKIASFPTLQRLADNLYFSKNIEKKGKINHLNKNHDYNDQDQNKNKNKNKIISTFLKSDFINSILNEELNQSPSLADSGFCQSEEDLVSLLTKIETKPTRSNQFRNAPQYSTAKLKEGIDIIDKAYSTETQINPKIKKNLNLKYEEIRKGSNNSKLNSYSKTIINPSNIINFKKSVVIDSMKSKNSQNYIKQHLTTDNRHDIIKQDLKKIILRPKKSQLTNNFKFPFLNFAQQKQPIIKGQFSNGNIIQNPIKFNEPHLSSSRGSTNIFHNIEFPINIKKHGSIERVERYPILQISGNLPFKLNQKLISIYNSAKKINKKSKLIKKTEANKKVKKMN